MIAMGSLNLAGAEGGGEAPGEGESVQNQEPNSGAQNPLGHQGEMTQPSAQNPMLRRNEYLVVFHIMVAHDDPEADAWMSLDRSTLGFLPMDCIYNRLVGEVDAHLRNCSPFSQFHFPGFGPLVLRGETERGNT